MVNKLFKDFKFYLSRKVAYPLVEPDVLQLSITNDCNLRCKSCNVWRNGHSSQELTLKEIEMILKESADWGVKEAHILGGEPFLREDWDKIALCAKSRGMSVVICSNGTLIDDNLAKRIIEAKVDLVSISLDGAKSQTHDFLRGQTGAYDKIIKGINAVNKYAAGGGLPKIVLILTVSKVNLPELKEYIDLAHSLSVCGVYFTALVLDNVCLFSQKKTHDLWIEEKDFASLDGIFQETYEYAVSKGFYLDYPSFRLFSRYFKAELKKNDWVCFAGFKRLVVTHAADIQICGEIVGNYRKEKSLRKIWASHSAHKRRLFVKNCSNYCLQDCHARPESNSFYSILRLNKFKR